MICNASAAVALVVHWHLMSTVAENRLGRVLTCQYFNYPFHLFVLTSSFCDVSSSSSLLRLLCAVPDKTGAKNGIFFGVLSLCLSRACLGKMIVFI
jgi:hypothetical protein